MTSEKTSPVAPVHAIVMRRIWDRFSRITTNDMEQIAAAASGCIDKTIGDWQYLDHALNKLGIRLHASTTASEVTALCQFVEAAASIDKAPCDMCGSMRRMNEIVCGQCTYRVDGSDRENRARPSA